MDFEDWLAYGIKNGFCSNQACETHEGHPMTELEMAWWDEGLDLCAFVVRLGTPEDWDNDAPPRDQLRD